MSQLTPSIGLQAEDSLELPNSLMFNTDTETSAVDRFGSVADVSHSPLARPPADMNAAYTRASLENSSAHRQQQQQQQQQQRRRRQMSRDGGAVLLPGSFDMSPEVNYDDSNMSLSVLQMNTAMGPKSSGGPSRMPGADLSLICTQPLSRSPSSGSNGSSRIAAAGSPTMAAAAVAGRQHHTTTPVPPHPPHPPAPPPPPPLPSSLTPARDRLSPTPSLEAMQVQDSDGAGSGAVAQPQALFPPPGSGSRRYASRSPSARQHLPLTEEEDVHGQHQDRRAHV